MEIDEQTGFEEKVISESRDKKAVPTLRVVDSKGVEQKSLQLACGSSLDGKMTEKKSKLVKS